jgi:hypothetical protein
MNISQTHNSADIFIHCIGNVSKRQNWFLLFDFIIQELWGFFLKKKKEIVYFVLQWNKYLKVFLTGSTMRCSLWLGLRGLEHWSDVQLKIVSFYFYIFTFATVSSYITLWRAMHIYHFIDTFATSQDGSMWWQRVKFQHFVAFLTFFLKSGIVINHKCKYK